MKAPLILGYDLANPKCTDCTSDSDIIDILTNEGALLFSFHFVLVVLVTC
jgi:hypothetical protein